MDALIDPRLTLLAAAALLLLAAALFWPRRGLLPRWRRARQMGGRVHREDALKHIHTLEMNSRRPTVQSIAGALQLGLNETAVLIGAMEADGLLAHEGDTPRLTPTGRAAALHIIRAHRLWEHYLAEETGYGAADWHALAEEREHGLSAAELDELAARLGHPVFDPHGDPIPAIGNGLASPAGEPLATLPPDIPARIVHLEDEPEAVYAQLVAEGLAPGMVVRVTAATAERVRFWANGDEHVLAPLVAANVFVRPLPPQEQLVPGDGLSLAALRLGQSAEVVALSPALRGRERRRLLDLGLLPGTRVTAELRSPAGDPTAYRIRGAVVALRAEQAKQVRVTSDN
ncbi:MAG: FeoA domain-containing protein [Candidatus Promineofilum sp.]|nr:FeoA domain-containing protein [Promineifilum sp.]